MAASGNLKFAIFVVSALAVAACIALIVEITKKKCSSSDDNKNNGGKHENDLPYDNIRLPRHVVPLTYDLCLNPVIEEHVFDGKVDILLQVNFPRNYIVLHNKWLTISNIHLLDLSKATRHQPVKVVHIQAKEQIYIRFSEDLRLFSDYKLHLEFKGKIDKSLAGFYRSTYHDPISNSTKTIGVTQFEATDARKAFPCFDEPAMKAVFNVKITRKPSYTTWFNTPLHASRVLSNGLVEDTFATTVKMSSYLVAWVIGDDMTSIKDVTQHGVDISIVTPSHMIDDAKYALTITKSVLDYYVTLFGVPFPLPKLDLVAIPDFAAGAMENWGLITYRLTKILINDKSSSALDKQSVAMVISHEIAHQWFGDIVTMKWWTDLWLNEGFASYVEYLGIDHIYGEDWSLNKQFVSKDLNVAMAKDCFYSSHPILIEVQNPEEIGGLFDDITYYKGASVIRMAKFMLTEEKLKISLQNYMKRYQFDNTVTSQLWDEFNKVVPDIDVRGVMDTWTRQMGYPVLTTSRQGSKLRVDQERFLLYPQGKDPAVYSSPYDYVWKIPFTVYQMSSGASRNNITILEDKTNSVTLASGDGWYKANTDFYGYYRVNYDKENWVALVKQLNKDHTVFSEMDRAQLIDDSFNIARAGQSDMSIAFDLTTYLKNERSYTVWAVVERNLNYITARMDADTYGMYKKYMSEQLDDTIYQVGWNAEFKHIESLLQNKVLSMGVSVGHAKTLKNAVRLFRKFSSDPVEGKYFPSDLKDIVYAAGVEVGGKEGWQFLWNRYLQPDTKSGERHRIILVLSTSRDKAIIKDYLDMAFDTSIVPLGNFIYIIKAVGGNSAAYEISWQFLVANYDAFLTRYGKSLFAMSDIMIACSSHFSTIEKYNEVKAFFEKHQTGSGSIAVGEILEKISMNIAYMKNNGENVKNWLKEHV